MKNLDLPLEEQNGAGYCKSLGVKWATMLKMNVVVLDDVDGKITPEEFDEEISDLSMIEIEKLMNDILMHPIHYIKGSHIYYIIFPSSEKFVICDLFLFT